MSPGSSNFEQKMFQLHLVFDGFNTARLSAPKVENYHNPSPNTTIVIVTTANDSFVKVLF